MSSNKSARQELEMIFGKVCMIEELGIRNIPKDKRKKLTGYTRYDDVLTYHHIKEKHLGGSSTFENGALVRGYNHRWLHALEPAQREKINQALQDYKLAIMSTKPSIDENGNPVYHMGPIKLDFDPKEFLTLPLTPADKKTKKKFNRAQSKREFRQQVEAGIYEYENQQAELNGAEEPENCSGEVLNTEVGVYMRHKATSSDMMKLVLRSALKNRAQEILEDTDMTDEERQAEFAVIEEYMKYITDFEDNQRKLTEYDKLQRFIADDGR